MKAAPARDLRSREGELVGLERLDSLRAAVLAWWPETREVRDALPWRNRRDPWQVLVAEIMLAQTQAARVAAVYPGFIARFPTVSACADAAVSDVLRAWSGLGYNRRAAALHETALRLVERHGGLVPDDLTALLDLPGVGAYTARAVRSFAFGAPEAVLDTNTGRVLARAVAGAPLGRAAAQALADLLLGDGGSRAWNLALMDLGATRCTGRRPDCARCPLRIGLCRFAASGFVGTDPAHRSAAVARRQSAFAGSDRQGRGALLRAACDGPIPTGQIAAAAGWPENESRALAVASRLVEEGLLVRLADGAHVLAGDPGGA